MPLQIDLAGTCAKITRQMSDITKENYPFLSTSQTGIIDFLLNPLNGGAKLDLTSVQMGKKTVKTKLVYKKPTLACQILEDDDVPTTCEEGEEPDEESVDVTINKKIGTPTRTFDNARMINICQDTEAFIKEYVMSDLNALREKAGSYLLQAADAAAGKNLRHNTTVPVAAGTNTDLELLTESNGVIFPNFANFVQVRLDYINNKFKGYPHIVGQGNLQYFYELSKWSCCNASGVGYDSAVAQSNAAFYLDQQINENLGSNEFLVFAPNVAHLLWFNENRNIEMNNNDRQHITIPDPVYPGLKWDFDMWFDCKKWNYKISTWLDFFSAIQDDAYGDESESPSPACSPALAGVNGIFKYRATQGS